MDNVRDILRYATKVKRNSNNDLEQMLQKHTGIQMKAGGGHGSLVQMEQTARYLEREFLEIHENTADGKPFLRHQTRLPIKDINDVQMVLEKCK